MHNGLDASLILEDATTPARQALAANLVAHWPLNGTLADASPNSLDLEVHDGTITYVPLRNRLVLDLNTGSAKHDVAGTALQITGDMSFFCTLFLRNHTSRGIVVQYADTGEVETDNILYMLDIEAGGIMEFLSESGAGSDTNLPASGFEVPTLREIFVGFTRSGSTVKQFIDGLEVDSGTAAASGGSQAKFFLGDSIGTNVRPDALIADVHVTDVPLTPAHMALLAADLLGRNV